MTDQELQNAIDVVAWWREYTEDQIRLQLARPTGYSTRPFSSFWYFNVRAMWERTNGKPFYTDVDAMIIDYAMYFDIPLDPKGN